MPRKNRQLNPLELQKQLLLAESELNRTQLLQEWQSTAAEVRSLVDQSRTLHSLASATAVLINGLASLRRQKSGPAAEKPSWWQTVLQGAQLAGSLWSESRRGSGGDKAQ